MHIPDGYLGPATYGTLFAATIPFWAAASWKLNRTLKDRQAPFLAIGAAFSFTNGPPFWLLYRLKLMSEGSVPSIRQPI